MKRRKWVDTGCLAAALLIASVAWSAPQDNPGYTIAEYNMNLAAHLAKTPADKIALLDAFVATFPTSSLLPVAYVDYSEAYRQQRNYARSIEYMDQLLSMDPRRLQEAFHDRPDPNAPLLPWLVGRAQTFLMGCDQPELRTPEAYRAAIDSAAQGQQALTATEVEFVANKQRIGMLFDAVARMAESGLNGDRSACKAAAMLVPSDEYLAKAEKERSERYDRFIEQLQREAPPVQPHAR